MTKNTKPAFIPPYNLTWRRFTNSWDKMAQGDSLPAVIDRSYLRWMAGSAQTSYLTLARQFGLVDEQSVPTDLLRRLVYEPESRPPIIGELVREHYAPIVDLGTTHSTTQQLMDLWKETYGQDGDTRRKAITFFMQAAEFAGIQVSPLWEHGVTAATSRQTSRPSATRRGRTRIPKQKAARNAVTSTPSDTIRFADGAGSLSISVDVDLFKLSTQDREFVFRIVDAVRQYQHEHDDTSNENETDEVTNDDTVGVS